MNTSWSAKTGSVPNWSDRTRVDTVTGADTMRSRLTDASAPWSLCMLDSHKGHYQCSRLHPSFVHASTFLPCLPSARASYSRASRGLRRSGTMQALTPAAFTPDDRSLRLLRFAFGASNPQPRDAPERRFCSHLIAPGRTSLRDPGFALTPRARRNTPPNRYVILQAAPSPPVALHPASRRRSYHRLHLM